jgi:hypothetical protein
MSQLVAMSKEGVTINVHETLRDAHERAGWEVAIAARSAVPVETQGADPSSVRDVGGLSVGKGPGGRFYVKRGKEIVTGPYASEEDARAALAAEHSA